MRPKNGPIFKNFRKNEKRGVLITLSTKNFGAKNFGGNIFGGKNFGELLPYFGVNFGENRTKIRWYFFSDF